ncbi:MAG TPA: hypothetical protein PLD95_00560 [bacterium]|jgi:magnesium-transporting ATPase (P-type)|nr:hypothetical protein [bacterium]HOG37946.1 hypothetical protein [bacterium]HQI03004.1 hypothetical protein [bacterium]
MSKNRVLDLRILSKKKKKSFNFKKLFKIIIIIILIVGICFGVVVVYKKIKSNSYKLNMGDRGRSEKIIKRVSRLIELPSDEIPQVANVLNEEKLKDYPFFENAENGDNLLIYTKSMKVILYRPSTDKIIGVAPLYVEKTK